MKISNNCIELVKDFEGCELVAYKCPAGVWTIGYGHTDGVHSGQVTTKKQAENTLKSDLAKFESKVRKYIKYNWNQNEFDALVSFAFNIGSIDQLTAKGTRTKAQISEKILAYNKASGKVLPGLTRRRKAEKDLFDKKITTGGNTMVEKKEQTVSTWAKDAHSWVVANKISDGTRPKDAVTREQAWTMLYNSRK